MNTRARPPLKILFIATKSPWPTVDGGRLLVANTLEGLAAEGHQVTLVAPAAATSPPNTVPKGCRTHLVAARPRSFLTSLLLSQLQGRAVSIVRHSLAAVRREVARLLDAEAFDVVHAEQLQALAQAQPAFDRGVPVVLRAQNVESDLWAATAASRAFLGLVATREARRLARSEGAAVARSTVTVALTSEDAERLRELASGQGRIHVVRVPFKAALPPADARLDGEPALVLLGSEGWLPNRDAVDWFVGSIWPAVRSALPGARLHVYGNLRRGPAEGVSGHRPPDDSRDVFAPGSVMVVPLRIGSGVRMKILEAWARGVPVVASPQAVRGLEAEDGRDLLVARDAAELVDGFRRLYEDPGLAARLADGGRASLVERHDPARAVEKIVEIYARSARNSYTTER